MWEKLKAWFGPVANSIRGKINVTELVRIILTAVVAGMGAGGVGAALDYLQANIGTVLVEVSPEFTSILMFMIATIFDFIRRKYYHGVGKRK